MAKKTNKSVYIVAMLLFLGGLGYLIFSGLTEDSVYFLNVNEALAMPEEDLKQVRLFGKVSPKNIDRNGSLGVSFDLLDKMKPGKAVRVDFKGAVPDTFKADVEVILEGGFVNGKKNFKARTLVTKCPSKYKEKSAEMDKKGSS